MPGGLCLVQSLGADGVTFHGCPTDKHKREAIAGFVVNMKPNPEYAAKWYEHYGGDPAVLYPELAEGDAGEASDADELDTASGGGGGGGGRDTTPDTAPDNGGNSGGGAGGAGGGGGGGAGRDDTAAQRWVEGVPNGVVIAAGVLLAFGLAARKGGSRG